MLLQVSFKQILLQYKQLVTDLQNYMSSVSSPSNVNKIVKSLKNMMKKKTRAITALKEVEMWETSLDKFIDRLQIEYALYKDLTEPFICAVQQVCLDLSFFGCLRPSVYPSVPICPGFYNCNCISK